jgi:uncharacterized membrane protein
MQANVMDADRIPTVNNSTVISAVSAAASAAICMYLFDPTLGRRRRALLRDRMVSTLGRVADGSNVAARDLAHRAQGATARARRALESTDVEDGVLVERVRAALGRATSHPGAIEVTATEGRIILSGQILAHEHKRVLKAVRAVRGTEALEDRLEPFKRPGRISALQGGRPIPERARLFDENWPPAFRLLAVLGSAALLLYGARQRGLSGLAAAAAGGALAARSATNVPLDRLAGAQGRRGIDIRKTIHVEAPVERVFETLSNYENFPAFMRNVREVTVHPDGRSHWVVAGPAGVSVEWDAQTSVSRPNELLGWRTVRSASVQHAGLMRFEPEGAGTRLDIRMTYNPPAGALGHVVAKLFGADAKTELDEDLMRLKTFLETGTAPRDAAAAHKAGTHDPIAQTERAGSTH